MKKNYRRGFTLIELLVVIAIIGILAAIVLVSLNSARSKARDTRRAADLAQIQLALEMYADSNNSAYPIGDADCTTATPLVGLAPLYMPNVPVDPSNSNGQIYRYCTPTGLGTRYILGVRFENNNQSGPLGNDLDACSNLGAGAAIPTGCSAAAVPNLNGCLDATNSYCIGI